TEGDLVDDYRQLAKVGSRFRTPSCAPKSQVRGVYGVSATWRLRKKTTTRHGGAKRELGPRRYSSLDCRRGSRDERTFDPAGHVVNPRMARASRGDQPRCSDQHFKLRTIVSW